jgi:hypothetical protein
MGYSLAAPQGASENRSLKTSNQQLAGKVGCANLGPSLPVAPLVQDDDLKRGGLCAAQL